MSQPIRIPKPQQSAPLQLEAIQSPPSMTVAGGLDPVVMTTRKRKGREYHHNVVAERQSTDLDEARRYDLSTQPVGNVSLGQIIPAVQLAPALSAITQLFILMNQRLAQMDQILHNSTAYDDADDVKPPQRGDIAPPDDFPTTVAGVRALSGNLLTRVENYYGLAHTSSLAARVRRVRRAYGIGLVVINSTSLVAV